MIYCRTQVIIIRGDYLRKNLDELYLVGQRGEPIALSEIVTIVRSSGLSEIKHEHARRFVSIQTNVTGIDLVTFVDHLKANIAKEIKLPAGYSIIYGGQFKNQQATLQRLSIVVPIKEVVIEGAKRRL